MVFSLSLENNLFAVRLWQVDIHALGAFVISAQQSDPGRPQYYNSGIYSSILHGLKRRATLPACILTSKTFLKDPKKILTETLKYNIKVQVLKSK